MPAENPKLGFVGAGMMASAMINGIIAAKATQAHHISASDLYNKPGLDRLAASGVRTTACNAEVAAGSRVIFLAVKPDVIPTVLREIRDEVADDTLLVSIALGVTISALEELAPGKRVVRVMPNTPCLVSEMAAAFCMGSLATDEDKKLLEGLLGSVGYAIEVPESKIDAVTGLSGSGPAYVFMMIEALADGGVRMGLPRATALQLAAQTVKGAATMVLETGTHPAVLKDQVCSPGGSTIAAVEALEKGGFRAAVMSAVIAASNKSIEMRSEKK
ncbi:unnamed protein product [Ascophyllum nodosum]